MLLSCWRHQCQKAVAAKVVWHRELAQHLNQSHREWRWQLHLPPKCCQHSLNSLDLSTCQATPFLISVWYTHPWISTALIQLTPPFHPSNKDVSMILVPSPFDSLICSPCFSLYALLVETLACALGAKTNTLNNPNHLRISAFGMKSGESLQLEEKFNQSLAMCTIIAGRNASGCVAQTSRLLIYLFLLIYPCCQYTRTCCFQSLQLKCIDTDECTSLCMWILFIS